MSGISSTAESVDDTSRLLTHLVGSHAEIEQVHLARFESVVPLRERARFSPSDLVILGRARRSSRRSSTPFPESLLGSVIQEEKVPDSLLNAVLFHRSVGPAKFGVKAEELTTTMLHEMAKGLGPGAMLTMCSEVRLKGDEVKHVPMLDFSCPRSARNLSVVSKISDLLNIGPSFVVETENSYHCYGSQLLTWAEYCKVLSRATLLSPVVDRIWVAHQIVDSCAALRITSHASQGGFLKVVAAVG